MQWILSTLYPSDDAFRKDLSEAKSCLKQIAPTRASIQAVQRAGELLRQLDSYVSCLQAQDTRDQSAHAKRSQIAALQAAFDAALFTLGIALAKLDDATFSHLTQEIDIAFQIKELRTSAKQKAVPEAEALMNDLSIDGYHSQWTLYQMITGKIRIGPNRFSVGQAYNRLSHSDRSTRLSAFADWKEAWKSEEDTLAQILNSIAGFRLRMYAERGWEDPLFEPLFLNRMEKATFDAMWKVVDQALPHFQRYLAHKAKLLGVEKLSWVDIEAPLAQSPPVPYDEARTQIIDLFTQFYPQMGTFAEEAFEKQWIEAEDREGKSAGGFCVLLPKTKESRIFMTYMGTPINVATLAHELGHAYHNFCMKDLPYFAQEAKMNVAETASTFAEALVIDQQIAKAPTPEEKKHLLDDKLQRCIAYFMNLRSRLDFELSFYKARKEGFVSPKELCQLMEKAQKNAYGDALADWEPHFWASKLHFFFTDFPFYNFPYTFGFLMSSGLYARAKKDKDFGPKLDAFLRDTGRMQVEDLAEKHLGVDLRKGAFWEEAIAPLIHDVGTFLRL